MKTSDSIAKATVSLFEAVDLPFLMNLVKVLHIFAADRSSRLTLAMARAMRGFHFHLQKCDWRRMDEFIKPEPRIAA